MRSIRSLSDFAHDLLVHRLQTIASDAIGDDLPEVVVWCAAVVGDDLDNAATCARQMSVEERQHLLNAISAIRAVLLDHSATVSADWCREVLVDLADARDAEVALREEMDEATAVVRVVDAGTR